jgi:hypothetical protein
MRPPTLLKSEPEKKDYEGSFEPITQGGDFSYEKEREDGIARMTGQPPNAEKVELLTWADRRPPIWA